jgi:sporulation protein YlmC with PRC-barrel domain
VVQGEETAVMGEDQVGAVEGDTGDIGVGEDQADAMTTPDTATEDQAGAMTTPDAATEDQAGAVTTPDAATEDQAGAMTTPDAATEDQAGAVTTPDAATEDQAGAVTTPDAATEEQAGAATTPGMGQFDMMSAYKASEFIGYPVQNPQGEDLGEIEDLMVDPSSSQVRYAVLSFGGFLDIGDKLFAIPLDAIEFNPEEQAFIMDVDQERLEQAPGFERENWPDTANPDWDMGYSDFWLDGMTDSVGEAEGTVQGDTTQDQTVTEDEAVAEGEDATGTGATTTEEQPVAEGEDTMTTDQPLAGSVLRASEIMDYDIHNSQGEELGEVEDLIVQMSPEQHMVYAVVAFDEVAMDTTGQTGSTAVEGGDAAVEGGDTAVEGDDTAAQTDDAVAQTDATGLGEERFYAIPLSNLQFSPEEEDVFVFNADPQMLDTALSFSPDEWSNQMNLEDVN